MSNPISKHFSKGIWLMLLATFSFSLMNIFAKLLHRLPVMEIVFFRCFISVLFCTAALLKEKLANDVSCEAEEQNKRIELGSQLTKATNDLKEKIDKPDGEKPI